MRISNFNLGIGVPCDFPFIPASFFYSFVMMEKPNFTFIHKDNGHLDDLRNDIVEKAIAEGCTHLIMMDVDQIYPTNTIPKLLSHKLPVVGCKINRRYPPFDPLLMKLTDEGYKPIDDYEDGSLVPVDATGAGCVLFDMEVFRTLPYPWFKFRKNPDNGLVIGEDVGLCQDLKAAGYDIYVDTSIKVGHLATIVVNDSMHNLYNAMALAKERKAEALGFAEQRAG